MTAKKQLFVFMVLSLAPFFSLTHAELATIPATETTSPSWTDNASIYEPTMQEFCDVYFATGNVTLDFDIFEIVQTSTDTQSCRWRTVWPKTVTSVTYQAWSYNDISYTCDNPLYPNLIAGNLCQSEAEPYCGLDTGFYISPTSVPSNSICLGMSDGVSSCEYSATYEDTGSINGYSFTPTGEGCDDCGGLIGAIPCLQEDLNQAPVPPPDPITDPTDDCFVSFGIEYCTAGPADRCDTTNGVTTCDDNCGYLSTGLFCGDTTLPDSDVCSINDTRPECAGVSDGSCPPGFDCTETTIEPTDNTPCVAGDIRASCVGQLEGETPSTDTSALEGSTAQQNELLEQANINSRDGNELLSGILANTKATADALSATPADTESLKAEATAQGNILGDMGTAANEAEVAGVGITTTEEGALTSNVNASVGYFSSLTANLIPTPTGACSPYILGFIATSVTLDICTHAAILKTILAWLINITLITYLFNVLVVRSAPEVK